VPSPSFHIPSPLPQIDGDPLLAQAIDDLECGDFQQRWDAAKTIRDCGEGAIAPLVEMLRSDDADEEVCWFIARILGELGTATAIAPLVELLEADREETIAMAATTLASLGTVAVEPLAELLEDSRWRKLAVRAIAGIRHTDIIPSLLRVTDDEDPQVRAIAMTALGSFSKWRVLPALVRGLQDPSPLVRREAAAAVGVRADLLGMDKAARLLDRRLEDEDIGVAKQAAVALSRCPTPTAAAALGRSLSCHQTPVAVQIEIVRALGWMDPDLALPYLERSLLSPSVAICRETIRILGNADTPEYKAAAARILIERARSGDTMVCLISIRQAIAYTLGRLGDDRAIDLLTEWQNDKDPTVRLHAIAALDKMGDYQ